MGVDLARDRNGQAPGSGRIRPPRIARDPWRLNLTLLATLPAAFLIGIGLRAWRDDLTELEFVFVAVSVVWAVYAAVYLVWTWAAFRRYSGETLRGIVRATTPRTAKARLMMWLLGMDGVSLPLWGAIAGFAGVVALILVPSLRSDGLVIAAAFLLVTGSWVLMITAFAVTYARSWAGSGGVEIPGEEPERFTDFLYTSVQVATTFATSDVETRTAAARNWVSLNSVIAFAFNTVVIALFLSVATSAAG